MKRLSLIWLTVLALLTQSWSAVAMASTVKSPAPVSAVAMAGMEHCSMPAQDMARPTADTARKSGDCCGAAADCHCVSACGSAALLPALFTLSAPPATLPIHSSAGAGFAAAPAAHPFRPPIL